MLFENRFDRRRFRRVIRARRRAVCVDVANVGWTQIAKRHADRHFVPLTDGGQRVDLVYAPQDYRRGLRITWVSLLVLVVGLVVPPLARRRRGRGPGA